MEVILQGVIHTKEAFDGAHFTWIVPPGKDLKEHQMDHMDLEEFFRLNYLGKHIVIKIEEWNFSGSQG